MKTGLLLAALLLPFAAVAQGLYKWTDEKGGVHYSDRPPAGNTGQKMNVAPPPPGSQAAPRSRSWQEQQQDANERRFQQEKQQKEAQQSAQEAQQKCLHARGALDTLKRERPIFRVDPQGEREYMSDEERQRQIAGWQQQADAHCR